jgi:hypothetical protein
MAIPKQRRGKNVSAATNKQEKLEEFLEVMFNLYIVYQWDFRIVFIYEL